MVFTQIGAAWLAELSHSITRKTAAKVGLIAAYSPDFNPIEMAFSKLKAILKQAAARTVDELWEVIAQSLDEFTPAECQNYFVAAGYEPK